MYALANIDFSDRLGFIVSELTPDEIDGQDQTLDASQGAALSLPARGLEVAVFFRSCIGLARVCVSLRGEREGGAAWITPRSSSLYCSSWYSLAAATTGGGAGGEAGRAAIEV
jgi:hypothetical protein